MGKRPINATIDDEVWFYHKMKKTKISEKLNNLLRLEMEMDQKNEDETKLRTELEETETKIKEEEKKRQELFLKLENIREKREAYMKEEIRKSEQMADMNRIVNPLRDY